MGNDPYIIVKCPHPDCQRQTIIYKKEFNCKIFRCGVFKKDFKQINPHLKKSECQRLKKQDLIYGCGKPFRLVADTAIICGYI